MDKKQSIIRTAFCLCTSLLFIGKALASVDSCESVVLSGHPDLPPVVWGNAQTITGAAPELVSEILEESDIEVISDYFGGNNRVLSKMRSGSIDINPAMVRTRDMEESVYFVEPPIYTQNYSVIVKKGARKPETWHDLVKLQGVTPKGLSFGTAFDQFAREQLKLIRTFNAKQGLMMLNIGRVDYAIYPDVQGDLFVSLLDFEGRFEKAPVDIASFELYIGVSRHLDCKLPLESMAKRLNYLLKTGRADHAINDNLYKWMGFSLDKRSSTILPASLDH